MARPQRPAKACARASLASRRSDPEVPAPKGAFTNLTAAEAPRPRLGANRWQFGAASAKFFHQPLEAQS
jgi:hypothetical protein